MLQYMQYTAHLCCIRKKHCWSRGLLYCSIIRVDLYLSLLSDSESEVIMLLCSKVNHVWRLSSQTDSDTARGHTSLTGKGTSEVEGKYSFFLSWNSVEIKVLYLWKVLCGDMQKYFVNICNLWTYVSCVTGKITYWVIIYSVMLSYTHSIWWPSTSAFKSKSHEN